LFNLNSSYWILLLFLLLRVRFFRPLRLIATDSARYVVWRVRAPTGRRFFGFLFDVQRIPTVGRPRESGEERESRERGREGREAVVHDFTDYRCGISILALVPSDALNTSRASERLVAYIDTHCW